MNNANEERIMYYDATQKQFVTVYVDVNNTDKQQEENEKTPFVRERFL